VGGGDQLVREHNFVLSSLDLLLGVGGFESIADQVFVSDCVAHGIGLSLAAGAFVMIYPVAFSDKVVPECIAASVNESHFSWFMFHDVSFIDSAVV
jgi:hypothetical protein